jgi:hypothetical protein
MAAGKAIWHLLSNSAALAAEVGANIFPVTIPENTGFPAVAYAFDRIIPTKRKDGNSPLDAETLNVVAYSLDYAKAQAIGEAIRAALDGQTGTIAGDSIDRITFENQEDNTFEGQYSFFVLSQQYTIRNKR